MFGPPSCTFFWLNWVNPRDINYTWWQNMNYTWCQNMNYTWWQNINYTWWQNINYTRWQNIKYTWWQTTQTYVGRLIHDPMICSQMPCLQITMIGTYFGTEFSSRAVTHVRVCELWYIGLRLSVCLSRFRVTWPASICVSVLLLGYLACVYPCVCPALGVSVSGQPTGQTAGPFFYCMISSYSIIW